MSDALTRTIDSALSTAGDATAESATIDLRQHARGMGWPERLVATLTVRYEDGIFEPHYPQFAAREVEDLEYGTIDSPPIPALRTWENQANERLEKAHDALIGMNLFKAGVLS